MVEIQRNRSRSIDLFHGCLCKIPLRRYKLMRIFNELLHSMMIRSRWWRESVLCRRLFLGKKSKSLEHLQQKHLPLHRLCLLLHSLQVQKVQSLKTIPTPFASINYRLQVKSIVTGSKTCFYLELTTETCVFHQ